MDVAQLPYIDERPRLTVGRQMQTLAPAADGPGTIQVLAFTAGELAACRPEEVE